MRKKVLILIGLFIFGLSVNVLAVGEKPPTKEAASEIKEPSIERAKGSRLVKIEKFDAPLVSIARGAKKGKPKVIVTEKAIKIFDDEGNLEREEILKGNESARVSANGKYFAKSKFILEEPVPWDVYGFDFEYKDIEGRTLFIKKDLGKVVNLISPDGEFIVFHDMDAQYLEIIDKNGRLLNKLKMGEDIVFSFTKDGKYFVAGEWGERGIYPDKKYYSHFYLFNNLGKIIWEKQIDNFRIKHITFIEYQKKIAMIGYFNGFSSKRFFLLDLNGRIFWYKNTGEIVIISKSDGTMTSNNFAQSAGLGQINNFDLNSNLIWTKNVDFLQGDNNVLIATNTEKYSAIIFEHFNPDRTTQNGVFLIDTKGDVLLNEFLTDEIIYFGDPVEIDIPYVYVYTSEGKETYKLPE